MNKQAMSQNPVAYPVVIEISADSTPVKYEVDKASGRIMVDRFMGTSLRYPCNYGYIPDTLGLDGDPIDVLVITPYPVLTGALILCRVIGLLEMTDEAGQDTKIIAVPMPKIAPSYKHIQDYQDLPASLLAQIKHFFEHYKDLDPGKWIKVEHWDNAAAAHAAIEAAVQRFTVPK